MEQAKPLLETLPAGAFAGMMKKQLAVLTKMEPSGAGRQAHGRFAPTHQTRRTGKKSPSVIRHLITSLLHEPQLAAKINLDESWLELDIPGMSVLKEILSAIRETPDLTPAVLLERFRGGDHERTINALFAEEKLIAGESTELEFLGAVERLKEQAKKSRKDQLLSKSTALSEIERAELRELMKLQRHA